MNQLDEQNQRRKYDVDFMLRQSGSGGFPRNVVVVVIADVVGAFISTSTMSSLLFDGSGEMVERTNSILASVRGRRRGIDDDVVIGKIFVVIFYFAYEEIGIRVPVLNVKDYDSTR